MRRTSGSASVGAVKAISWPSRRPRPMRTATSARRSSFCSKVRAAKPSVGVDEDVIGLRLLLLLSGVVDAGLCIALPLPRCHGVPQDVFQNRTESELAVIGVG